MTTVGVIGCGYVGLATAATLSHLGHTVTAAEVNPERLSLLQEGKSPLLEDGLEDLLVEGQKKGNLLFVESSQEAARHAEIVFLCVQTPMGDDGRADLSFVEAAVREIGPILDRGSIVVTKSTVPVGSSLVVGRALKREDVSVVSNPEFLQEGAAVHDSLHPTRIVIGSDDQAAAIKVAGLFDKIQAPLVITDPASAETIKYAANSFLAMKVSFANAVAALSEAVGANVADVVLGIGYDHRIGAEFLRPGPGWGGSCFAPHETVLANRDGRTRLTTFAELWDDAEANGADGLSVLSWRPGEPGPELLPVSAVTARPADGLLVVRTKMGRRVTVTADHPFVVGDGIGGDPTGVKLASELTSGDWLPVAVGQPVMWDIAPSTVPIAGAMCGTATNGTYVPESIVLDDEFWRMIGLYLAEGCISRDGQRERIQWSFHPTEEEDLVAFVAAYWRERGVKVSVYNGSTSRIVSISSRVLAAWFEHGLGLGRDCYTHRLPDIIWEQSTSAKESLLRGLWDGDGSWSLVNGGPSVAFEYGTASSMLADGMMRLFGDLGFTARLKIGRTPKSTVDTSWIIISGANQIEDALFLVPDEEAIEIQGHISYQSKRIRPTGYRELSKNASWVRVTTVDRQPYNGLVYSVEVPDAHTVVTSGGLVVHNCFPKDVRAMRAIAQDSGYDFYLLDAVIQVNDEQFDRVVDKVEQLAGGSLDGKLVAAWGLTFKARTADLRDSPAIEIIRRLQRRGAEVRAYDPTTEMPIEGIGFAADPYAACDGADVLVVLTEWDEFRWLDFTQVKAAMASPAIVDARNLLEPASLRHAGFSYLGIGR